MDATDDLPTVLIGRSILTCTHRTSRITARCAAATNPTPTRRLLGSTWRYMGRVHLRMDPATTRTTRTMIATVIAHRLALRHQHPRLHLPALLITTTITSRHYKISTAWETTTTTIYWVPCLFTIRPTCRNGTSARARLGCPLRLRPSIRPSDQWVTSSTIQHRPLWLIDVQLYTHRRHLGSNCDEKRFAILCCVSVRVKPMCCSTNHILIDVTKRCGEDSKKSWLKLPDPPDDVFLFLFLILIFFENVLQTSGKHYSFKACY